MGQAPGVSDAYIGGQRVGSFPNRGQYETKVVDGNAQRLPPRGILVYQTSIDAYSRSTIGG